MTESELRKSHNLSGGQGGGERVGAVSQKLFNRLGHDLWILDHCWLCTNFVHEPWGAGPESDHILCDEYPCIDGHQQNANTRNGRAAHSWSAKHRSR